MRPNFGIEKGNDVFISVKYKSEEIFQKGAKKNCPKAKKHNVHGASSENINCCKSGKNAENKEKKSVEAENGFGSAVAEKSEEKTKKPTGEFAFINGDTDAGGQNKNRVYAKKVKKTRGGLDYICEENNKRICEEL